MKKLLFLFLLFPMFLFSQTKIVLKGTQVTISSLANIAGLSVVANATGSPATPTSVLLGVGLTFSNGKLAIDTANFKDSIYAVGGLSIYGTGFNKIGLGGFLSQNVNISGSNAWAFTIDSMQAAVGRGFRVNFGLDAGWDIPVRDSATGFWTRVGKGTVGQGLIMLPGGGIGWGTVSSSSLVRQNIISGTSGNVTVPNSLVKFNPASALATYALTLPTGATDLQVVEIEFGGTIISGPVVTSLTILPNSGWTIQDDTAPTSATAANFLRYTADATLHIWYRRKYN